MFVLVWRAATLTVYFAKQKQLVLATYDPLDSVPNIGRWLDAADYVFSVPICPRYVFIFPLTAVLAWVVALAALSFVK